MACCLSPSPFRIPRSAFLLPALRSSGDYILIRYFVMSRLCSVRKAPGRAARPATRRFSFSAAEGVIYRVHCHTADTRPHAHPARPAGLADADVLMVKVAYLADGCHALGA